MELVQELAARMLSTHPERAALVLETRGAAEAVAVLSRAAAAEAAGVVRRLSPSLVTEVLSALAPAQAGALLGELDLDHATRLARRLSPAAREAALEALGERRARALRALLGFREDSAGALMDPEVLALPDALTVAAALERVRSEPGHARYNLYVVDSEQCLVGALNLRELLLADPDTPLVDLMVRQPLQLRADADRADVLAHPGWREVHSLPVVDDAGRYLGAVRYRTLRELEEEQYRRTLADVPPARALGELLALGAAGALDAFAGSNARRNSTDER